MKPGQIAVVFEPVACGKFNKVVNKVGTVVWVTDTDVCVLFDDNYLFTGPKKSAKLIKSKEEQDGYVETTRELEQLSEFDSKLCSD
jgi:hypothetical protein